VIENIAADQSATRIGVRGHEGSVYERFDFGSVTLERVAPPALRLARDHVAMKTILRSTAAIALLGAATAAGTYPTAEEACGIFEGGLVCQMHEDKAACEGDSNCEFNDDYPDWTYCEVKEAFAMPMEYAFMNASAALEPQNDICGEFEEEACSGSCAYGDYWLGGGDYDYDKKRKLFRKLLQDGEMHEDGGEMPEDVSGGDYDGMGCYVAPAKAASLLVAEGADPYTKGYASYAMAAGFVCPFKENEAECNAASGCLWGTSDYDYDDETESCRASPLAAMLMINNKCQGSLSDVLVKMAGGVDGNLTIAEVYEAYGVVDESSASALADAADAKVEAAADAVEDAKEDFEALIEASTDLTDDEKAKATVLYNAATAGLEVKKVVATIDAADPAKACATGLAGAGLTADNAACIATAAGRRKLLADYSTEIIIDPTKVDATAAAAAVTKLETKLGADKVAATDENPVAEMETVSALDATTLETFKTSAVEAGTANLEAQAYQAEESVVEDESAASFTAASALATAAALAAAAVFA
jgi:hypothetical protein